MNLEKLKPWNWSRHENRPGRTVPVTRRQYEQQNALQEPLNAVHREVDRLFENTFARLGMPLDSDRATPEDGPLPPKQPGSFSPEVNIASEEDQYVISMEAAGMDENDLSIELHDRDLIIRGEKQDRQETRERHYYHMERRYGSFQRIPTLPEDADEQKIQASMNRGVLTIRIPRRAMTSNDTAPHRDQPGISPRLRAAGCRRAWSPGR